jgi:hypothetical protein
MWSYYDVSIDTWVIRLMLKVICILQTTIIKLCWVSLANIMWLKTRLPLMSNIITTTLSTNVIRTNWKTMFQKVTDSQHKTYANDQHQIEQLIENFSSSNLSTWIYFINHYLTIYAMILSCSQWLTGKWVIIRKPVECQSVRGSQNRKP